VGGALRAGFRLAVKEKYTAVVQVDADGQHPIPIAKEFIKKIITNEYDLVQAFQIEREHGSLLKK
jgi:hypothetical protein